jgi:hypothetical protein
MPLSYEIDQEHRLVITTAWDIVSAHEALELQHEIRSDTRLPPDFLDLVDLTRLTSVDVDINVMNELAARRSFAQSRRAFVVGSNKLAFGMARMFIALRRVTGDEQMQIFTLGVALFD